MRKLNKKQIIASSLVGGLSMLLLLANLAGFFVPLRNAAVYIEAHPYGEPDLPILTEAQFYKAIEYNGGVDAEYVAKVNNAVHEGIAYIWDEPAIKFNRFVPVMENWLLWLGYPAHYWWIGWYEFFDYRRAIERGIGECSQQFIIVAEVLRRQHIDSKVLALVGHTVAMAEVDGAWWVLDPTFNVVIKYPFDEIREVPGIIVPYYSHAGVSDSTVRRLISIYGEDAYNIYDMRPFVALENLAYFLKWAIPLGLVALAVWMALK
jgi:hypothetical protein